MWPIKIIMCVGLVLMLLQAVAELIKDLFALRGEKIGLRDETGPAGEIERVE